jgi:hypothetical protein
MKTIESEKVVSEETLETRLADLRFSRSLSADCLKDDLKVVSLGASVYVGGGLLGALAGYLLGEPFLSAWTICGGAMSASLVAFVDPFYGENKFGKEIGEGIVSFPGHLIDYIKSAYSIYRARKSTE